MSLTELLLATLAPDKRAQAEAQIKSAEQASPEQYFVALAQELANNEKAVVARQLSGLLLKNGLFSKDSTKNAELKARWEGFSAQTRTLVKECTANALLANELDIGKSAAQVLAKIGAIEIPKMEWPGLVPLLLTHVSNTDPRARQISLITLGYLCEDLVAVQEEGIVVGETVSNQILTAVVQGMQGDNDANSKLEATRAFYHTIVLAQKNFKNDRERDYIMKTLFELCKLPGAEAVQSAALECLAQIASEHYEQLSAHMEEIGMITLKAIKEAPEKVAIPAMEFWSTVCDEEVDIKLCIDAGETPDRKSLNIIHQALQFLVPLLTETLTKQQSEDDEDSWNLAMAAGTCLQLVAQVVGDACVDAVLAFVEANFVNPDWKFRDAAVLAYGSIMEGPSSDKMRPLVQGSYIHLVQRLQDPSVAVRDTVAWTLGRIVRYHPSIIPLKEIVPVLIEKLADVPRVSANICWVIQGVAESMPNTYQAPPTTPLSEFFPALAQALLTVVKRPDAGERQLRMSGYNALSIVCSRAGADCMNHMQALTEEMAGQLSMSFKNLDGECELQGLICGVLQALVNRLRDLNDRAADLLMEESLKVLAAYQQVKGGAPVIQEEALMLIIAIVNAIGPRFERFMPHFAPHFRTGLQNYEDVQTCYFATGAVGDISRALDAKLAPFCDTTLEILFTNLQNPNVDRKIKAAILGVFGDVALAIGGDFEKYLEPVVKMMLEASRTKLEDGPSNNEDWIEYLNTLRAAVLEGYSGILVGLRDSGKAQVLKEHVNSILQLVQIVTEDVTTTHEVMKQAVGVVGDLIAIFQQELTVYLGSAPFLVKLVDFANRCEDMSTKRTASWLTSLLQKYGTR
mmetsp:Transcript_46161/g.98866  ORF Transcript_46161/g.98866 Transcript_46161/m.98866 type:complete len:856 (+) Transcript_46161:309-2876(+)